MTDGRTISCRAFRTDKSNTTKGADMEQFDLGGLLEEGNRELRDRPVCVNPQSYGSPDVTAEDLEPVYVGTDSNISFQGSPRIESTGGQGGPFDFGRQQPAAPRGAPPQPAPAVTPAPQILVPGGMPSDPFRPNPRDAIPPQPVPTPAPQSAAPGSRKQGPRRFRFEPASLSLAPGECEPCSSAPRAGTAPEGKVEVAFDPAILAVLAVRAIPAGNGIAEARVEPGRVVLDLPAGTTVEAGAFLAEITVRAVAPGRSKLAFDKATTGGEAWLSEAAIEVRTP